MKVLQTKWAQRLHRAVIMSAMLVGAAAYGHGGVVEEDDVCVIKISYLKAHFKIYQPNSSGKDEYCEDLPDAGESIFIMEYLHDELTRVPIDFRIIRNVTGKGLFARWQDVEAIDDLEGATVYYQPPVVEPDVFMALHNFDAEGDFIGVVTAKPGSSERRHIAVFPFEVGYTSFGFWPLIALVVILAQLQYLFMSGKIAEWRAARRIRTPELTIVDGRVDES